MGPLSDRDLRAVVKSLGISANALNAKLERVSGALYDEVSAEVDHLEDLLRRYRDEQTRRRHKRSA